MVVNQKNENLSQAEASWLPGAVRDRLEVNLQMYTHFLFVDAANLSSVKKLQKQFESSSYNEIDAIELGKLDVAKYAVFVTLRKSGNGYTVVADVTDLTTGQKLASVMSSAKKTADELFSTTGCAADDITVKLCDKLGIPLSNTQKYALMHGEETLSNEEQLKMMQEEESAFKNAIAKYDAELSRLSKSNSLDSLASKAKMEADKALAQEKLKASQERAKRLEEEAKKAAADKAEDAARSDAQKKRRDQMAKEAAEKAAAVRKATVESGSIFTKINVIESKKKAILDIQKSVDDRIAEIKKDGEDEFAKKQKEIMDAPYRAAEKNADGTPSATAKDRRERQMRDLKEEIDSRVAKECEEVKSTAFETAIELYYEIQLDKGDISKKIVSSLENDLKVQIGMFDGKTNAWNVKYWLYSNGVPVTNGSVNLAYTDLTGKAIDTSSDKAYDEFMDTVDLYNSLFSRGDPVLTFKMNYKTESVDDYSSKYIITLTECDVLDTVSGRKICTLPVKTSLTHQAKPIYDLRCELFKSLQYVNIYGYICDGRLVIRDSVTSIGNRAFEGCTSLSSVEIPDGVTSIGSNAFEGCTSLSSVVIPGSVTSIGGNAFSGCESLKSVLISSGVTSIGDYTFYGCKSLSSIVIPSSVTSIGEYAFEGCKSLESVVIPDSVTSIGEYAFAGCTSLKSVVIPNSVTSIGNRAFWNCTSLKKIVISDSVRSIGMNAFRGCTSLEIPDSVASIWDYALWGPGPTLLETVVIPDNVTSIRDYLNDFTFQNVVIPNSVTSIGFGEFSDFSSLKSVVIPDSVTSIGDSAFYGCKSLESVVIPNSVVSIGDNAFFDCTSLSSVVIPNSVTSIGENAFERCTSLSSVVIPDSVASIGEYAFWNCTSLKSITIKAKKPPLIKVIVCDATVTIYVPKSSIKAYQKADIWKEYASYIKPMK